MPYGEEAFIGVGNRAVGHGYTYGDSTRQKFTGYERDEETNLDFAQARMYSNQLGRFTSVDPVVLFRTDMSPQHWNKYGYAVNNPLIMIDVNGEFPYTVYVRSFAPTGAFRRTGFKDDNRDFSTDTNTATSRIEQQITIDPTRQEYRNFKVSSSPTNWNGIEATETPTGSVVGSYGEPAGKGGTALLGVAAEYSGRNALTKKISETLTPAIDVQSSISIAENTKKGRIAVNVKLTGDGFPATESFIKDYNGKSVFIVGANAFGNVVNGLAGNDKHPVASATLVINIDKKGGFIGVQYRGKKYTVDEWNKKALDTHVSVKQREDLTCNCN